MLCSKNENNRINKIHKRAMRCVSNSPLMSFMKLLEQYQIKDFHTQNLQSLMCFIYNVVTDNCPNVGYNLFSKYLLELPDCSSINYKINTIFF